MAPRTSESEEGAAKQMVFGILHSATVQLLTESQKQTRLMRNQHDFLLNMKWACGT